MEKIYILNMVCDRCITSVGNILENLGIEVSEIRLGEVEIKESISKENWNPLSSRLKDAGFELLSNPNQILISKIKTSLLQIIQQDEIDEDFKISTYLTGLYPYDYSHLSRLFSHVEPTTIEKYFIKLRIEKAKQLLQHREYNVSEVAYKLGYTSIAHFSRQFKKIVGVPPSVYRVNPSHRISFDNI